MEESGLKKITSVIIDMLSYMEVSNTLPYAVLKTFLTSFQIFNHDIERGPHLVQERKHSLLGKILLVGHVTSQFASRLFVCLQKLFSFEIVFTIMNS